MFRKAHVLFLLAAVLLANSLSAQLTISRFLVSFRDKGTNTFSLSNPSAFLSQRSIDRRTRYGIALDSTDLPVTQRYLDTLRSIPSVTILNSSKWLNQVSIRVTDSAAIDRINALPFVRSVSQIAARSFGPITEHQKWKAISEGARSMETTGTLADVFNYGASGNQVRIHNGQFLHNIGLRGQNMIIGMLDAGFKNYLTVPAFDSARAGGQILNTHDFVARESSVNEDSDHGMQAFSTIAANIPGQFVGTAPKANYLLFRTEDVASETPIEEHNWVCGAERIDSAGGDLVSSSLGYYNFDAPFTDYTFSQLDGNTTISARGADLGAKKGLLIFNSAGNEGGNSWGRIVTPADGDSVYAVGAVNSAGQPASFTSRGPSADGQVKPDGVSHGVQTTVQFAGGGIGAINGTSFACPNLAGLAACLWQGFPEYNNMTIIRSLHLSSSRFSNPSDTVGYGIPNVKTALILLTKTFSTASAALNNCRTTINWTSKDMKDMRYEIERRDPGSSNFIKVGDKTATGAIFGINSYSFSDSLILQNSGSISYRIRQVFDTAVASFTSEPIDTVTLTASAACISTSLNPVLADGSRFSLMPNPARDQFMLKVHTPNAVSSLRIVIVDAGGRLVKSLQRSKPAGEVTIPMNIPGLAAGKYYVSLYVKDLLLGTATLIKL